METQVANNPLGYNNGFSNPWASLPPNDFFQPSPNCTSPDDIIHYINSTKRYEEEGNNNEQSYPINLTTYQITDHNQQETSSSPEASPYSISALISDNNSPKISPRSIFTLLPEQSQHETSSSPKASPYSISPLTSDNNSPKISPRSIFTLLPEQSQHETSSSPKASPYSISPLTSDNNSTKISPRSIFTLLPEQSQQKTSSSPKTSFCDRSSRISDDQNTISSPEMLPYFSTSYRSQQKARDSSTTSPYSISSLISNNYQQTNLTPPNIVQYQNLPVIFNTELRLKGPSKLYSLPISKISRKQRDQLLAPYQIPAILSQNYARFCGPPNIILTHPVISATNLQPSGPTTWPSYQIPPFLSQQHPNFSRTSNQIPPVIPTTNQRPSGPPTWPSYQIPPVIPTTNQQPSGPPTWPSYQIPPVIPTTNQRPSGPPTWPSYQIPPVIPATNQRPSAPPSSTLYQIPLMSSEIYPPFCETPNTYPIQNPPVLIDKTERPRSATSSHHIPPQRYPILKRVLNVDENQSPLMLCKTEQPSESSYLSSNHHTLMSSQQYSRNSGEPNATPCQNPQFQLNNPTVTMRQPKYASQTTEGLPREDPLDRFDSNLDILTAMGNMFMNLEDFQPRINRELANRKKKLEKKIISQYRATAVQGDTNVRSTGKAKSKSKQLNKLSDGLLDGGRVHKEPIPDPF